MENEFLLYLKGISLEVVIISFLIFVFTMLLKWPIKKVTSKLEENKRKAINTVIVFIPILLSFIFSSLYFGIFKNEWFSTKAFETMGSSYVLTIFAYAVYSRIIILIKGVKNTNFNENLSKETIKYIKNNIKTISKTLKIDEKNLSDIVSKIEKLLTIKDEISKNLLFQDISQTEQINNELNELEIKKQDLSNSILSKQIEIQNYEMTLTKKGENK